VAAAGALAANVTVAIISAATAATSVFGIRMVLFPPGEFVLALFARTGFEQGQGNAGRDTGLPEDGVVARLVSGCSPLGKKGRWFARTEPQAPS